MVEREKVREREAEQVTADPNWDEQQKLMREPIDLNLTPLIPLSLKGEGERGF